MKIINVQDGIMKCEHCKKKTIKRIYTVVDANNDIWLVGSDCVNSMIEEENVRLGGVWFSSRYTRANLDRMVYAYQQKNRK